MSAPEQRRVLFLYMFGLIALIYVPFVVPFEDWQVSSLAELDGRTAFLAGTVTFLIALRAFKAGTMIGSAICLWFCFWLSHHPVIAGDPQYLPLLTLICVPLVMGMVSGAIACVLGTISVLAIYTAVAVASKNLSTVAVSHDLSMLAYAGVCTIIVSLVYVYFNNSSELQTGSLQQDKDRIQKEALTDPLTGCANRRAFLIEMDRLQTQSSEAQAAVVIVDLDRFKQINDTFGHKAGDQVLTVFADRLNTIVGTEGRVFRMGGDEFAIIREGPVSDSSLRVFGEQIVSATEVPVSSEEGNLEFEASIGIAISQDGNDSIDTLYQQADTAMFAAKEMPGATFLIFDSMLDGAATRRFEVEQCLKCAIDQGSIKIAMQPQVNLRNGSILGYEALSRWEDPLLGKVSPSEFVPIAENSSLVEVLDRNVIANALRDARYLLSGRQTISINVSARSLNSKDFGAFVLQQISRNKLTPAQVELEITETALIENWEKSKRTVVRLRENGVSIAIDDFGVGYSSLSYLTEFPIQKIKFDRSFVQRVDDPSTKLVMESIVDLAQKMKVSLVAEGIETKVQLNQLRELGCLVGQGYLLGRPSLREEIAQTQRLKQLAA